MDEFESLSHTKWDCKYHVVFIPKRRRKTLYAELRRHLAEVFRRLAMQKECRIEEGHLLPDHVHMMISIPPKYAVSQVVGFIKGKSAWSTVRGFGNIKYFNISYGVLFGVPILHELYAKSVPFMTWFGAPGIFPTTLRWAYVASVSFAIAIVLYQWFCPAEIKRFGKSEGNEYLETQQEVYERARPNQRLNIVLANLDPFFDQNVYDQIQNLLEQRNSEIEESRLHAQKQLNDIVEPLHADAVQRFLLKQYERLDLSKPAARWASFCLYVFGTAVLLVLFSWRTYGVLFY